MNAGCQLALVIVLTSNEVEANPWLVAQILATGTSIHVLAVDSTTHCDRIPHALG